LRQQYKSIKLGSYTTLAIDDTKKLYAFIRRYADEEVIVIINRGNKPLSFTHPLLQRKNYKDVFTKALRRQVTLNPFDVVVLGNK
jgi:glycosidase